MRKVNPFQSTGHILMMRPEYFIFNKETAISNKFQQLLPGDQMKEVQLKVLAEFDNMVEMLEQKGVVVNVFRDTPEPPTPDAVFPNNWVVFHHNGEYSLFPMQARSRRGERRMDVIEKLKRDYKISSCLDYTHYEKEGKFLEGTGSMVIDHINRLVFACRSPRTHEEVLIKYCRDRDMKAVLFNARDSSGVDIYHTNVMMCIGTDLAVICLDSIPGTAERMKVREQLQSTKHEIIDLKPEQLLHFAGNMLELRNSDGDKFLVMSDQARQSLNTDQVKTIEKHLEIVHPSIPTIESIGGGSVRCMIAEIFTPMQ